MNRVTAWASHSARRSFVLVMVLVFLLLAGSLLLLTTHGTTQLLRTARRERASIVLRQMIDSGRAWAEVHRHPGAGEPPVTLDVAAMLPTDSAGRVTLTAAPDPQTLIIEAHLDLWGWSYAQTAISSVGPGTCGAAPKSP